MFLREVILLQKSVPPISVLPVISDIHVRTIAIFIGGHHIRTASYTDRTAVENVTYYYTVRALRADIISPTYDDTKFIKCSR